MTTTCFTNNVEQNWSSWWLKIIHYLCWIEAPVILYLVWDTKQTLPDQSDKSEQSARHWWKPVEAQEFDCWEISVKDGKEAKREVRENKKEGKRRFRSWSSTFSFPYCCHHHFASSIKQHLYFQSLFTYMCLECFPLLWCKFVFNWKSNKNPTCFYICAKTNFRL